MQNDIDVDDIEIKHICFDCVGEEYLAAEIRATGHIAQCSYCEQILQSHTIGELANRIEIAFEQHYVRTSDQPNAWQQSLLGDRESDYDWERDGTPVIEAIEDAAQIPHAAAKDVQTVLDTQHEDIERAAMGEETEFSAESYYEERGASTLGWHLQWNTFEQSLQTEARFFSRSAAQHLASIFGGIDKFKTRRGRSLVAHAGPQSRLSKLYRARVFQADDKLEEALCRPDLHIGSPPARLANAGRMNARGISVFYGATQPKVAIAEVRPPVGSKVVVAKFNIVRPLCLLDLTIIEDVHVTGSIFDPTFLERLERVAFLQTLGQRMTKPVMPDDEAFEYLATQAIADFLATENEPLLDGIIFRSVQSKGGRNVVLFQKAARVDTLPVLKGTKFDAYCGHDTEDGWESDYSVMEHVPPQLEPEANAAIDYWLAPFLMTPSSGEVDPRDITLQADRESMDVHHVNWVEYRTSPHPVNHYVLEGER